MQPNGDDEFTSIELTDALDPQALTSDDSGERVERAPSTRRYTASRMTYSIRAVWLSPLVAQQLK